MKKLLIFMMFSLVSIANAGTLSLKWDASVSQGVGGYKIYYGTASKTYTSFVDVGNVLAFTLTALDDKTTYFVAVKSYTAANRLVESNAFSNEVSSLPKSTVVVIPTFTADFTVDKISGIAPFTVIATPIAPGAEIFRWDAPGSNARLNIITKPTPQTLTYVTPGIYKIWFTAYKAGKPILTTKNIVVNKALTQMSISSDGIIITSDPVPVGATCNVYKNPDLTVGYTGNSIGYAANNLPSIDGFCKVKISDFFPVNTVGIIGLTYSMYSNTAETLMSNIINIDTTTTPQAPTSYSITLRHDSDGGIGVNSSTIDKTLTTGCKYQVDANAEMTGNLVAFDQVTSQCSFDIPFDSKDHAIKYWFVNKAKIGDKATINFISPKCPIK